jgi:hypothetical protein
MWITVESRESRVESRKRSEERAASVKLWPSLFPQPQAPRPQPPRRGVLLLVVLSMLVLFMLIGTTFLMTSDHNRKTAKHMARKDRHGNYATKLLDRALMQLVRGTENPTSAMQGHDLLRDLYGTEGFQATGYQFRTGDPVDRGATGHSSRFAGATSAQPLGPSQGQLVDIFFKSLTFRTVAPIRSEADPDTLENEIQATSPDLRHVVKLERGALGQSQVHTLSLTKGYYNGCVLTITSGPAAGQSARIVDYEFIADIPLPPAAVSARLFRFRVMAFSRADGQPLQIDPNRVPEIVDLAGASFIVNGRPFNGTGVGYNPLAAAGQPRLTALELFPTGGGEALAGELALLPNARYFDPLSRQVAAPLTGVANPFAIPADITRYPKLGDPSARIPFFNYWGTGPGGPDESYDAADYQNMFLALLSVTPRAQARVIHSGVNNPLDVDDPLVINNQGQYINGDKFLRLDLEDVPLPSFHRPDLVNFWYHRLLVLLSNDMDANEALRAVLRPYEDDGSLNQEVNPLTPQQAALIAAIKRKIMLRPIREDHPRFDGGNPRSIPRKLGNNANNLAKDGIIKIPFWEVTGPWDVDNDNDGVPDSVWIDLGDPIHELEDGTRYKPLYALLVIDLDSRLNVNAHGLADHVVPPIIGVSRTAPGSNNYVALPGSLESGLVRQLNGAPYTPQPIGNFARGPNLAGTFTSHALAQGLGFGPAEISLRSVFPTPWANVNGTLDQSANRSEAAGTPVDSYATLLWGRLRLDGRAISGKYGFNANLTTSVSAATPGNNYEYAPDDLATPTVDLRQPDLAAQLMFFNYPWRIDQRSAFGTPPDLFGRYALGIDYSGQPFYETLYDRNPNSRQLPPSLLTDSPYELNLSSSQRRGTWGGSFADAATAFSASLVQNDDAPFATADLERVLRGTDADAGTLPSDLWDVVDVFDPLKLMEFDTFRVLAKTSAEFGIANPQLNNPNDVPSILTAAQQMAAINRRLVTTDSVDLPVVAGTVPNQGVLALGADGAPGRRGIDDNGVDGRDDIGEINAANTDDFRTLFGKDVAQAGIVDLLRFRVWTQVQRAVPQNSGETYAAYLTRVSQLAEARINGERFNDANANGILDAGDGASPFDPTKHDVNGNKVYDPPLVQLLAPELYAGIRMDINRPFGDGQDNNNNAVVDDPLEAGDPFLDVNGNGHWDPDVNGKPEPFINVDGSADRSGKPTYTAPYDQLWADLTNSGTIGEPIAFDYTNGQEVPIHPRALPAPGSYGGVRNLESQARQLYARHLYCLMLLLVDEDYIAPFDEFDPNTRDYLDLAKNQFTKDLRAQLGPVPDPNPAVNMYDQKARAILLRKLTCRQIAQWAANCADMRDSDAIMTPFEYDENPWDGWGVPDQNGMLLPLDGDAATDENKGQMINWTQTATTGTKVVAPSPPGVTPVVPSLIAPAVLPLPLAQTRGIVWGTERPELLITETVALHDRRTEDLASDFTKKQTDTPMVKDDDLDQRLRPRGSLFVELYNPWSPQGQYPAELYSLLDPVSGQLVDRNRDSIIDSGDIMGVELGRMSTFGAMQSTGAPTMLRVNGVRRSPVWRMIVVEENFRSRNDNEGYDDQVDPLGTQVHTANNAPPPIFRPTDPDRDRFDGQGSPTTVFPKDEAYVERSIYFTSDNSVRFKRYDPADPSGANSNFLSVAKPDDKLLIPPEVQQSGRAISARYFIAAHADHPNVASNNPNNVIEDVLIAPIKPGRYAVVGTAGAQYRSPPQSDPAVPREPDKTTREVLGPPDASGNPIREIVPRFVTTISRPYLGTGTGKHQTLDDRLYGKLEQARRIELLPSPNPEVQQVLVAANGGTPLFPIPSATVPNVIQRDNEVAKLTNGQFRNIYAGGSDTAATPYDPKPDTALIPPCVAIPVKDMSLSEPLDLYVERRRVLDADEKNRPTEGQLISHYWNPEAAGGEGMFVGGPRGMTPEAPYDTPFDDITGNGRRELRRNGTTRNYRTIHLQRLADPTLPWNPLPTLADGKPNPQHNPKLPVNIYRTIDTASADLTTFNGASSREPVDTQRAAREHRWLPENPTQFRPEYGASGMQRIHMRSLERGSHDVDPIDATLSVAIAPRTLWRQEPITRFSTTPAQNDMQTWVTLPANASAAPEEQQRRDELVKRASDLRLRDRDTLDRDIMAIRQTLDPQYNSFPAALKPLPAQFDIILDHSLGFQNESFGALASRDDLGRAPLNLPASADGKPMPDGTLGTNLPDSQLGKFARSVPDGGTVASTFPWLAWVNRPFVSANEILNVPAASSSMMLRNFNTITTDSGTTPEKNPYLNDALYAHWLPFGHLLNFFAPLAQRPDSLDSDGDGNTTESMAVRPPHFYRILEYLHVPSRYVGTDTMFTAEIFNDVPGAIDGTDSGTVGSEIRNTADPRYFFQPPFNKVSRYRDPGRVNLNTVTGQRELTASGAPRIWSAVFDGIMHRVQDGNLIDTTTSPPTPLQLGHLGPSWRDVVLSRKGYAQFDAGSITPIEKTPDQAPDVFAFGLNPNFPSVFSNPFRSPDAGDLVPLPQMMHHGVDVGWLRGHHYNRGPGVWGRPGDDNGDLSIDDTREAGYGADVLSADPIGTLLPMNLSINRGIYPLFSESFIAPHVDGERNSYFYYQPMTRLGNLVTNRSGVFAVWITVGYFEVEPAPNWNDPNPTVRQNLQARFGGDGAPNSAATRAALALYNRVYPDGYMLGKEVGSDTGDVDRHRGFYIIDRTEEVGFKPGEDLNVEKTIRLRRRIE